MNTIPNPYGSNGTEEKLSKMKNNNNNKKRKTRNIWKIYNGIEKGNLPVFTHWQCVSDDDVYDGCTTLCTYANIKCHCCWRFKSPMSIQPNKRNQTSRKPKRANCSTYQSLHWFHWTTTTVAFEFWIERMASVCVHHPFEIIRRERKKIGK